MPVDTKAAPHRTLAFDSFDDIIADLNHIEAGITNGTAIHSGNWTIGQITDHCARFLAAACDGFDKLAPAPVRWIARAVFYKKAVGPDPMPRGFKLPKSAIALHPEPRISDAEGIDRLRKELKRVLAGKPMNQPSALFGKLSHQEWDIIQRKHCAMHMGFIHPEGLDP